MQTLPSSVPDSPAEEVSGLTCPDCFGALGVSAEGPQRILHFRCRIGHPYSAVQEPVEASTPSMPALAIARDVVDLVLPIDGIADALVAAMNDRPLPEAAASGPSVPPAS